MLATISYGCSTVTSTLPCTIYAWSRMPTRQRGTAVPNLCHTPIGVPNLYHTPTLQLATVTAAYQCGPPSARNINVLCSTPANIIHRSPAVYYAFAPPDHNRKEITNNNNAFIRTIELTPTRTSRQSSNNSISHLPHACELFVYYYTSGERHYRSACLHMVTLQAATSSGVVGCVSLLFR